MTALDASGPSARYCTELPAALSGETVRITKISGTDEGQFSVYEDAVMDFECFASTRAAARTLAYAIRDHVRNTLPGTKVGADAFIISAASVNGPVWVPYDNTDVRRFVYTASIRIHSLGG